MVTTRHAEIAEETPVAANNTMRVLRILFNHARAETEDDAGNTPIPPSPTRRLKKKWSPEKRRRNFIKPNDLPTWWNGTQALVDGFKGDGETARDYLRFVLMTGLRRREAAGLKWSDVDFRNKCFVVTDTKNTDALELPLAPYLLDMLVRRYQNRNGERVFPTIGETQSLVMFVREASGVFFTVHDLRRSYVTYAESLDIGAFSLKALLNHRLDESDVTSGYIRITTERLRAPVERIADYILSAVGVRDAVVELNGEERSH